jgi:propanol-preferring alcohol dehydrogenase
MHAMLLEAARTPLRCANLPIPEPGPRQILVKVAACGVCRTDLHVVDGDLTHPKLPIVPGHEVVGEVAALGAGADEFKVGERVGVPWLGYTCGVCTYCRSGRENLCDAARFTGYTLDGGYAEYMLADHRYCFRLPAVWDDSEAAPLLCAGLIGHRAMTMVGDAQRLGLYGFGAAAHIVAQVAKYQGRSVFAFTRRGDTDAQQLARSLGAAWAGDSRASPPEPLDAAIIFAPVGSLVPAALRAVNKGGVVVCAGIHMSDIPSFPYQLLWGERRLLSVANLTRKDGEDFLALAATARVRTRVQTYDLARANEALAHLRNGKVIGAAVLEIRRRQPAKPEHLAAANITLSAGFYTHELRANSAVARAALRTVRRDQCGCAGIPLGAVHLAEAITCRSLPLAVSGVGARSSRVTLTFFNPW